jgi:hypothetical protein
MNNLPQQEKGPHEGGPKSREETPKKGGQPVMPITVLRCNKVLCAAKSGKRKRAASLPFLFSVTCQPHYGLR